MREIKFRGMMTTGGWVFGLPSLDLPFSTAYYNQCSYRICWHQENGGQSNAPVRNGTLGQFTGLLDKNGVEIYDGDIIRYPTLYETPEYCNTQYETSHVLYINGAFYLHSNDERDYEENTLYCEMKANGEDFEVIGNIHEATEIIK